MKKLISLALALTLTLSVACAKINPDGSKSFQAKFVENSQKVYVVLVAAQAFEQQEFIKGNIPAERHAVLVKDINIAIQLAFDTEQIADSVPASITPQAVLDLAAAVAKAVDDVQSIVGFGDAPLELANKVKIADTTFKILQAMFDPAAQQ